MDNRLQSPAGLEDRTLLGVDVVVVIVLVVPKPRFLFAECPPKNENPDTVVAAHRPNRNLILSFNY